MCLETGWLIKKRNLFFTVLEAEKSKIKAPAALVSPEVLFPCSYMAVLALCPRMTEG